MFRTTAVPLRALIHLCFLSRVVWFTRFHNLLAVVNFVVN